MEHLSFSMLLYTFSYLIHFYYCSFLIFCFLLRVEFLLKTDSGCPKDTRVNLFTLATPGNPLRYYTHRSPPPVSTLAHSRGPLKRFQSPVDMLEHRDTYGQAQDCSKGRQGSSVDRPCQRPSFCWIKFWHVRNPLPQSIRLRLSVLVRESEVYPPQIKLPAKLPDYFLWSNKGNINQNSLNWQSRENGDFFPQQIWSCDRCKAIRCRASKQVPTPI